VAPDDIRELFCVFGPVEVRRMFGGAGIYAEGRMFALVSDGVIYLKADAHNALAFEREQLEPFTYATRTGRRGVMSYRRMPDRLYDDPDELAIWARAPRLRRPPAARWGRCGRRPADDEPHARRDACAQATVTKGEGVFVGVRL
jgi:DNA transformation protein and related proteins